MSDQFKRCFYQNCSPTLRKVKPSSLFTLPRDRYPDWAEELRECRAVLLRYGYELILLRETERFVVVMLYHVQILRRCMDQKELTALLQSMGYSPALELEGKLELLRQRFSESSCPHEIGLFLGYPVEDVAGFITNHGENCKYVGDWKVYGDVTRAKRLFRAFRNSRSSVLGMAQQGLDLEEILRAC